jgi:hypothetical protein
MILWDEDRTMRIVVGSLDQLQLEVATPWHCQKGSKNSDFAKMNFVDPGEGEGRVQGMIAFHFDF